MCKVRLRRLREGTPWPETHLPVPVSQIPIAELRRYLIEAGAKHGTRIAYAGMSWSTISCDVCDGRAQGGAKPELTCPRGHRWDQDVNAAINHFSEIEGVGPREGGRRVAVTVG